jgi:hypothetical protein
MIGLGALLFAACNPGAPRSTSNGVGSPAAAAEAPGSSAAAVPGQTDTDWGRIWDTLPTTFPVYPRATPADDAGTELVTATFALEGVDARTVAGWMQTELERATYATEALNGPLEDGGFILESAGPAGCRIQVATRPLGGLTTVSVRYGAECPAP